MTRDWHTSTPDAAAAYESARGWQPSRTELAEERGYDPHEDRTPSRLDCRPHLAAAIREASAKAEALREERARWVG